MWGATMADVSAAATAMGVPESLVQRSVEARATASGVNVDDLLAAWAGGSAPTPPPPEDRAAPAAEEAPAPQEGTAEQPTREEATAPEIVVELPPQPTPAPGPAPSAGPYRPPVLIGARDNPMTVVMGSIGLFIIVFLVGLVGPSIPTDAVGARTSEIDYSETALQGQQIYLSAGCAACHTQMVRPIVADVGLGPVTLDDTNEVLGITRFGPDLSDVGSRITAGEVEAIIEGQGAHPAYSLAEEDLAGLVAYMAESSPSPHAEEEGS